MGLRHFRGPLLGAGLAVGAGVCCYCLYRAASGNWSKGGADAAGPSGEGAQEAREERRRPTSCAEAPGKPPDGAPVLGEDVCSSTRREGSGRLQQAGMNFPISPDGLEVNHIQSLIYLLESVEDPSVQEQALITLSNSAAFSVNQDIIRHLGGLSVIGSMLSVPATNVKEKALNALNNLSMNIKNQEELKRYIATVCEEVSSSPLNSELQLAGLRFLTNMSVTNDYHDMMTSSIPCFLRLLLDGDERTQTQVLKVLVNLSANPAMMDHLLSAQAPLLLPLFDSGTDREVLLRALVLTTNLTQQLKKEERAVASHHGEDSLFSMLRGDPAQWAQKLASLSHHRDPEVKEQVAKLIMQW